MVSRVLRRDLTKMIGSRISRLFDRLLGGETRNVIRGMLTLLAGTGMARLIGLASIPLLTRIYTPADYGAMSVYAALVGILAPILTLRYVLALPLPRTDALAINALALSGVVMACMSLLAFFLLWAGCEVLLARISMEVLIPWWWLVVLGAAAVAVYEAMSLWATRRQAYDVVARTKVVQSLAGECVKFSMGILGFKPAGLLLGSLVEQSGGTTSFILRFRRDLIRLAAQVRPARMLLAARLYRGFPTFRLPSQILLVFSTQAPAIISATLYGAAATGQFGLALMALAVPGNLIGQSVSQAFYGEIARLGKGSEVRIKRLVYGVQARLFLIGAPITVGLILFGEPIFRTTFGPDWSEAGTFASILAPFILLQLTSAPLVQVLNIYDRQAAFLFINSARISGLLAIYYLCERYTLAPRQFAYLLSAFLFAFYLITSIYIVRIVTEKARTG